MQVLKVGSGGADVRRIQVVLNQCMLQPNNQITRPPMRRIAEDGVFGGKTAAMVREFQRLNQLDQDGIVGPVTSYMLLPFIAFEVELAGRGQIRGRRDGQLVSASRFAARSRLTPARFGLNKARQSALIGDAEGDGGDADEAITVDLTVGSGNGNSFKPWFVLKPSEGKDAPEAEGTIAIESTVLRKKGFEFGGSLEFGRPLIAPTGTTWQWAGSISGSYTNIKTKGDTLSLKPIVDFSVKQGLLVGAGVGAEASIQLIDDLLELTVGGKVAVELDPHEGSIQVGPAVSAGLKFKWEVLRFGK